MTAEPKAMSHGLTTGGGGGAFVAFMSAASPEGVEQAIASAVAHASFFMDFPIPLKRSAPLRTIRTHSRKGLAPLHRARQPHRGTRYYGRKRKIQARLKSIF